MTGLRISAEKVDELGGFDFSEQLHSKVFYTDLDGEWYFFEKELLSPGQVK